MEPIKQTVFSILEGIKKKKEEDSFKNPEVLLKKVLAKREISHVWFSSFTKGILRLKVDSSSWLYYLSLRKEALAKRLSDDLPGLKDIKFSIGNPGQKEKTKRT